MTNLTVEPNKIEKQQNTYTTYTNKDKSLVDKGLELVEVNKITCTTPIPSYTNKLQGEEKLSDDDVLLLGNMNKIYSHIVIGGKHKIVSTKHCPVNGMTSTFEDTSQFYKYFEHEKKVASLNRGKAWLQWGSKSFFPSGVGFYPNTTKCPKGVYNFFSGLALKPKPGDCTVYLNHIEFGICDGDKVAAKYFVQWLAHMIQKPDEKPSVAILMKSLQGTGKGMLTKPILEILGQYGAHVNGHANLTQRFNSTVANKLMIFGDEVDLKDHKVADKLKGLISENVIQLERKGIEPEAMPNYSRFIFASNHGQVINAGLKERRYLIVEPVLKESSYYSAIAAWSANGGANHLLHYLMNLDISDFNKNKAPITKSLIEEKLCSLPVAMEFLHEEISKSKPFEGQVRVFATELINTFDDWLESKGRETMKNAAKRSCIGNAMKSLGLISKGRAGRGKGIYYDINDIDLAEVFDEFLSS